MKRPRQHVLEDESRLALRNLLPSEWLQEDINPDYGIDARITIVEGEEVTSKVFSVQIKATDRSTKINSAISLSIDTKNLIYYENYPLPVFILYYIKTINIFYYVFSQKYIREILSKDTPGWREQKTNTIKFSPECVFVDGNQIKSIVVESAFYVTLSQLNIGTESTVYWIDGIPKSDDQELKSLTLKALDLSNQHKFRLAIKSFERILKICTVSPSERMAILISLGNCYYSLSLFDEALDNYLAATEILPKVNKPDALEGKAIIFSCIGLVYSSKSKYTEALTYHRKALKIFRNFKYDDGEAGTLNNIGNIYRIQGELTKAIYNMKLSLKIHKSSGSLKGQAIVLGNIGNIFQEKGRFKTALAYYRLALNMHRKVGNLIAEANMLGSIGTIYGKKDESVKAMFYLRKALKIFKSVGELEGQATTLTNLANVYFLKHNTTKSIECIEESLYISRKIGNRHEEALNLANIGNLYGEQREPIKALQYYKSAEAILEEIGEKSNLLILKDTISRIENIINLNSQ